MLKTTKSFEKIFASQKVALFIGKLDSFFIKLPHLPKKIRIVISKIVPFLALILGIIGVLLGLIAGFFLLITIISLDFSTFFAETMNFVLVLFSTLFFLKAFKPLRKSNAVGWIYLFWAQALELINLIKLAVTGEANLLIGIPLFVIGLYLLFEIGQFYVYKKVQP